MQITYEVYYRNYKSKRTDDIGFFVDFWKEIDFKRGRQLATRYFGHLIGDPNALFVLVRSNGGRLKDENW